MLECIKNTITGYSLYRGYYTAARRYDFYLRVVKTIFYERAQRVSKILFLTHEKIKVISSSHRVMFCHVIDIWRYGKYVTVYFSVSHSLLYNKHIYYMDKGILLGTKTLVLIIRHYIRNLKFRPYHRIGPDTKPN
jgi:hypothetical protein